jgi:hypothetical protein
LQRPTWHPPPLLQELPCMLLRNAANNMCPGLHSAGMNPCKTPQDHGYGWCLVLQIHLQVNTQLDPHLGRVPAANDTTKGCKRAWNASVWHSDQSRSLSPPGTGSPARYMGCDLYLTCNVADHCVFESYGHITPDQPQLGGSGASDAPNSVLDADNVAILTRLQMCRILIEDACWLLWRLQKCKHGQCTADHLLSVRYKLQNDLFRAHPRAHPSVQNLQLLS